MRVAYLIPTNRAAQTTAVANLQETLIAMRAWYCEQMDRNGFRKLAPRYEFEADGVTPVIHTVNLATETDADLRGDGTDIFGRTRDAAVDNGLPVGSPGQIWLLIPEIYQMNPDGSIDGMAAKGVGNGSGDDPGTAVISSAVLSQMNLAGLRDGRLYDGLTIPEIGPYPLVYSQDPEGIRSLGKFAGNTISSVVSSMIGAIVHELTHGFGPVHDFRNDANRDGNLMANGFRGTRGALFPDLWPNEHTRLSHSVAHALSVSHYFSSCELISVPFDTTSGQSAQAASMAMASETSEPSLTCAEGVVCGEESDLSFADFLEATIFRAPTTRMSSAFNALTSQASSASEDPQVTIETSGVQIPVDGKIEISFTASDPDGLFLARLSRSVNDGYPSTVADLSISGTDVTAAFVTSAYTPGVAEPFIVTVYDVKGYRALASETVTPQAGGNQGATSNVRVSPPQAAPGASLLFSASDTRDPEGELAALPYEWQFDESEPFTAPSADLDTTHSYPLAGKPIVSLRVTDAFGVISSSSPIAIRIGEACGDGIDNDGDGWIDYPVDPGCASVRSTSESPECDDDIDNDGDNTIDWDGGSEGIFRDRDKQCKDSWRNSEEAANASPVVAISNPSDGSVVTTGDLVTFAGAATDSEDGDLTATLNWDSDLDGEIGTGGTFGTDQLSEGIHLITASVRDSGGEDGADAIQIEISPPSACDGDGFCEVGEDCDNCPSDCVSGGGAASCGNGTCETFAGEDCVSCPNDCNGKQTGSESGQYCCGGDETTTNPVDCTDQRCTAEGFACTDQPLAAFCCGDNGCEAGEDACSCSLDCGQPDASEQPSLTCNDTLDNDCDSTADCDDQDCAGAEACQPPCDNDLMCEPALGEDCNSCPSDCAGETGGNPANRYCCGDDVDCNDPRCTNGGFICLTDVDGDAISDVDDNCLVLVNGPGTNHVPNPRPNGSYQCDDDLDGWGNRCDCDFDQNRVCDQWDLYLFDSQVGQTVDPSNEVFDMDCDQRIGLSDFGILVNLSAGSGKMGEDNRLSGLACAVLSYPLPDDCASPTP